MSMTGACWVNVTARWRWSSKTQKRSPQWWMGRNIKRDPMHYSSDWNVSGVCVCVWECVTVSVCIQETHYSLVFFLAIQRPLTPNQNASVYLFKTAQCPCVHFSQFGESDISLFPLFAFPLILPLSLSLSRTILGGHNDTSIDLRDPISDCFYKEVWMTTAGRNATIYEKVAL